jgi:hypothetical protein
MANFRLSAENNEAEDREGGTPATIFLLAVFSIYKVIQIYGRLDS